LLGALPRRQSLRLRNHDYAQPGAYYVTLCTQRRVCLFGRVVDGQMHTNDLADIITACWFDLPDHYGHVLLDAFVVMPNHIHAVIVLRDYDDGVLDNTMDTTVGAGLRPAPTAINDADSADDDGPSLNNSVPQRHALPEIVRALKTFSSTRINQCRRRPCARLWQRGYYDHVVRSERDLERIRLYIQNNPARWTLDKYYAADEMSR
jgi:REP element-mobilizing transposase RayT